MIKTIILYFYELNYNEHHIASFISKVVHDLFSFRREVLANGPRLRQVRFGYFLLAVICYYVCAETTLVVLLALILYTIKLSAPGFVHNLSFGRVLSHFRHF